MAIARVLVYSCCSLFRWLRFPAVGAASNLVWPLSCGIHGAKAFPVDPREDCQYNLLIRPRPFAALGCGVVKIFRWALKI